MTQLELYKEALDLMKKSTYIVEMGCWAISYKTASGLYTGIAFNGLCRIIETLGEMNGGLGYVSGQRLKSESEAVLGIELSRGKYWFTRPSVDPEKAKQERIQHLENLIKLYEKD